MIARAADGLTIDRTQMPTNNTIISVSAGAALLTLVWFGRSLLKMKTEGMEALALALAVPGLILTVTGLQMTLTWPFDLLHSSITFSNLTIRPIRVSAANRRDCPRFG